MCRVGQIVVGLCVFLVNVCGWVLLFGTDVGNCDPMNCTPEVSMLVIIECAELTFLAFHCTTCLKQRWSSTDWLGCAVVGLVNALVVCLEFYIAWQEDMLSQVNLNLRFILSSTENQVPEDWTRWFVATTCLIPMFLFFYLILCAVKQSEFRTLDPHAEVADDGEAVSTQ